MKIGLFEIIFLPRAAAKNSLLMFPKNITKKKNSMTDFFGNCRLFDLILMLRMFVVVFPHL